MRLKRARLHILIRLFKCYYSKHLSFDLRAISMHLNPDIVGVIAISDALSRRKVMGSKDF